MFIPAELRLLKWVLVEGAKKGNFIMHNVIIIKKAYENYCSIPLVKQADRIAGFIPFTAEMDGFIEWLGLISDTLLADVKK